ncbi:MAG: chromosomal replication initiator protein DnaA [Caldiserica bacterium]|jgi:chromosomal replication initiator protein|nr:chromosomal replication initiator protein DnaA [Caldisericota bacterium]MDH7562125.1 chromosomal replication initiator protein DnaA [Caldisericota bacterium]
MPDLFDEPEDLWQQVLQVLKQQLSRPAFETWLKSTRALSLQEGVLLVGVPNEFARDWLQTRLYSLIKSTASSTLKKDLEVEFRVIEAPQNPPPAESLFPEKQAGIRFNPRYTFSTFVVGNSNRFAHAACMAVAEAPGRSYNPLFIYGGVGLGKTHLLQAIGHQVISRNRGLKVLYISSETFTNEVINGIRDRKMSEFRDRYRSLDLLLLDDVQFIAGKESTQEEFFHTFNALHEASKQIVISSDRPPKDIPTLEDRLRSRFEWGLIADIQPPDFETRIAILKKKIESEEMSFPQEVLEYIAQNITTNIRELEGALTRLLAYASLNNLEIDLPMAASVLKDIIPVVQRPLSLSDIQKTVASYFGLTVEDLVAKKRSREISVPRQIAMYLARELTDSSLLQIGASFGGRDHSTVLHACDKIRTEAETNINLRTALEEIKKQLSSNFQ